MKNTRIAVMVMVLGFASVALADGVEVTDTEQFTLKLHRTGTLSQGVRGKVGILFLDDDQTTDEEKVTMESIPRSGLKLQLEADAATTLGPILNGGDEEHVYPTEAGASVLLLGVDEKSDDKRTRLHRESFGGGLTIDKDWMTDTRLIQVRYGGEAVELENSAKFIAERMFRFELRGGHLQMKREDGSIIAIHADDEKSDAPFRNKGIPMFLNFGVDHSLERCRRVGENRDHAICAGYEASVESGSFVFYPTSLRGMIGANIEYRNYVNDADTVDAEYFFVNVNGQAYGSTAALNDGEGRANAFVGTSIGLAHGAAAR